MPTYHRSQRLRIVGTGPKVEQLQEGRFRLTFTCTATNPSESWMQGNKDQIMTAYGTLQSAQKNIAGIDPRSNEAYSDMVLFRTEANPSERDLIITLVYETATGSFVKSQDDKIDFELNGLQRVTRVTIAKTGTSLPSVTVGSTSITVNSVACKLASRSVEENDAFIQITEVYLQEGTVSKSIDNVGSQLAQVVTTFGADPAAITGYSIASKEESNFAGYQTNTFRFLKDDVQLSKSVDNQSPLKTEVQEWFKPGSGRDTKSNYSLINKQESNVGGIPTERYTFAKDNVVLSVSQDNVGSQLAIVNEVFNPADTDGSTPGLQVASEDEDGNALSGYAEADRSVSSVDGIQTVQIRYLKEDVQLSKSVDNESPLKTEVQEWFKPTSSRENKSNYSLVNKQESNVDGIPTERYTFAKDNVTLSVSEEKVGSQNAIVNEIFNPTSESITGVDTDNATLSGYSEADRTESNYDGIKTIRVRFLKEDVQLSKSVDNESPLKTEIQEWFKPAGSRASKSNYSLVNKQESNVGGIPTERYTFAKDNVTLSVSEEKIGSQNAIVNEIFNPSSESITGVDTDNSALSGYSEADRTESNYDGIKTIRVRFLKNDVVLSRSRDSVGSQKAVVLEVFNGNNEASDANTYGAGSGYSLAREEESNVNGVKTRRYTYLQPSILSRTDDKSNPACPITIVAFDKDENDSGIFASDGAQVDSDDYILVSKTERDFEGIETFEMRFEKKTYFLEEKENEFGRIENVQVEQGGSYSLQTMPGSGATINGTASSFIIGQEITEGIVPKRITTFSTAGIESVSEDLVGATKVITITSFISAPTATNAASFSNDGSDNAGNFILINDTNNRVNGVDTFTHRYARKNAIISTNEDLIGSQKSFVIEKFGDTAPVNADVSVDLSGHSVARKDESNVDGIKTFRYTFLQDDVVLSRSRDSIGSQKAVVLEVFNGNNEAADANSYGAGSSYVLAKEEESNVDGVKTRRYTYLEPSILSVQELKGIPEHRYTVRAFNLASSHSSIYSGVGTPVVSGISHVLVSSTEEDYAGIKTSVYVFESRDYNTQSRTEFGRIVIDRVEQSDSSTYSLQSQTSSYTVDGVSNLRILEQTVENNDNEVNKRITKFTTVGIDNVRLDNVGSDLAVVITKIGTSPTTTEANSQAYSSSSEMYSVAGDWITTKEENNRVNGLDIFTYTFLKKRSILSESEDKVGSQQAIVREIFKPSRAEYLPAVLVQGGSTVTGTYHRLDILGNGRSRYMKSTSGAFDLTITWNSSLERWEIGQVSTVFAFGAEDVDEPYKVVSWTPTSAAGGTGANYVSYMQFRKDQVLGDVDSSDTSLFDGAVISDFTETGYSLAKDEKSNVEGIETRRFTFLKPSILSVRQDFVEDVDRITVEAFNKTSTEVTSLLTEVTSNHKLVSQVESNHDGITTNTYVFETNNSDKIEFTENNRLKVTRTIYEVHGYNVSGNYSVGDTATISSTSVVLSQISFDQRGTSGSHTRIVLVYIEPGEDSRSVEPGPTNIPGTERVTIRSTGITATTLTETTDIKLVSSADQNNNGFKTFTRVYVKGTDASATVTTTISGRTYKMTSTGNYSNVGGPSTGVVGGYFQATSSATIAGSLTAHLVSQIIGTKNTYSDVISVNVPGTVQCKSVTIAVGTDSGGSNPVSGTETYIKSTPATKKRITATVTQQIQTTVPSATSTLAYNIDALNCSVATTSTVNQGARGGAATAVSGSTSTTAIGRTQALSIGAKESFFPGHYLIDSSQIDAGTDIKKDRTYRIKTVGDTPSSYFTNLGASAGTAGTVFTANADGGAPTGSTPATLANFSADGTFSYTSSRMPRADGNVITNDTATSTTKSSLIATGSVATDTNGTAPSSYSTSGTVQQKARPVLTCLDGTIYYEVITFTA